MKPATAIVTLILLGVCLLPAGALFFHTVCCQERIWP